MLAPSGAMIATAVQLSTDASLLREHASVLQVQTNELRSALPNESDDFYRGYAIGLETARVALSQDPRAIKAGVNL